jgi:short-subunit dehydrogenase
MTVSAEPFAQKYGPYALVAGGSYGLGAAFAEGIARRGVNLVIVARNKDALNTTAARIRETHGVDVKTIVADLADVDNVKKRVSALSVEIGLFVYDAAFVPIGPFAEATEDQLAAAAAVNVRAPLLLTKFFATPMITRGRGGIVLMSSLAGGQGSPNLATYAATKAFNTILAEGLWKELSPLGVDVLVCTAGAIMTPGYEQAENVKPAPGTLPPVTVAETTLDALGNGPVVVPGAVNKIGRFMMTRLLSRRAAIGIMSKNTGGLS